MKKIMSFVFCSIFTLLSGVLLCSCGSANHFITFTFNEPDFVTAKVLENDVEIQPLSPNKFEVSSSAKIRVKFYAEYGVDMSNLVVKANGKQKEIQTFNTEFDSLHLGKDLWYGYVLFNGLDEDVNFEVSGADSYKNNFTFTGMDLEDEVSKERLQNVEIKLPGKAEFEDFYGFLSKEDPSFKVDIIGQGQSGRAFQIKFVGRNPYEITTASPFMLELQSESGDNQTEQTEEGDQQSTKRTLQAVEYEDGVYTFQLGDIGNNVDVNIVTDFKSLQCKDFDLNLPKSNLTYQVTLDEERETFNFESEAKVTVKKTMAEAVMNKEDVKAFVNNLELEKDANAPDQEDEVTFVIPKGITPESTEGDESYDLRVTGISYGEKEVFTLGATSNELHPIKLVNPDFFSVDEQGELSDVVGLNDEGAVVTFSDTKVALAWKYDVLNGHYTTPYDLYDYDIFKSGEKLFNLKALLDEGQQKDGFVEGQDIFVEKENFALRAHYNSQTQKYDSFQVEFFAEENLQFTFENFVLSVKDISISYGFDDDRVGQVEYAIGNEYDDVISLKWTTLSKDQAKVDKMKFGDVLFFKLEAEDGANLGNGEEFMLAPTIANQGRTLDVETFKENGKDYIVLKFPLADTYFDGLENLKLVLGRDLTNA